MILRRAKPVTVLSGATSAILLAALLSACTGSGRSAQQTAQQFVNAWDSDDTAAMAKLVYQPSPSFAQNLKALTSHLGATSEHRTVGQVTTKGSDTSAPLTQTYDLPGIGPWTDRSGVLHLVHQSNQWLVAWSPTTVDKALHPGQHLSLSYDWPDRAAILGAGGAALTTMAPQVVVGLEGRNIKNPAHLTTVLKAAGANASQISTALAAAAKNPTDFEPVFTISQARYTQLGGQRSALYIEPGTIFQHTSNRSAVTPGLAQHIVGSVGPITAEELKQLGAPYDAGSTVGQTGLESAYQKQLAGKPGGTISVIDASGSTAAAGTLATFKPAAGASVTTTIDPGVQAAAESAMSGVAGTAALVAVKASTGQILASVSLPKTSQFDEALGGEFPPGSTFKILTSTALFQAGLSPSSPASCPQTANIDGMVFHNAEGESPVSNLGQAFTESCNTAFVQLATAHLQASSFPTVASLYGIGSSWKIGLPAFAGRVPAPKDAADLAATAIGQSSVVLSPLNMAMVAAAVSSGTARSPQLVAGAGGASTPSRPLPASVLQHLRQMMSSVVTHGTAAGTGLPAGTFAKTGTAQYGSGNPLPIDAWLAGYRGDVAFAMVVQNSKGNGGPVDGPVIAKFLDALPAAYK